MRLHLSDAALEYLAQQGYEPMYGARPVKRAVTQLLETPLARAILAEEFVAEDTIEVDADGGRLVLKKGAKVSAGSMDAMAVGARG
jgi:ATP-dependent Clp protease ATP-binding subunit ClpB